jgi:hypothetical protein
LIDLFLLLKDVVVDADEVEGGPLARCLAVVVNGQWSSVVNSQWSMSGNWPSRPAGRFQPVAAP